MQTGSPDGDEAAKLSLTPGSKTITPAPTTGIELCLERNVFKYALEIFCSCQSIVTHILLIKLRKLLIGVCLEVTVFLMSGKKIGKTIMV